MDVGSDESGPNGQQTALPIFRIVENRTEGRHGYVRVQPEDGAQLEAALAPRIRQAYLDVERSEARLRSAVDDLEFFDTSTLSSYDVEQEISSALDEELDAVLPAQWKEGDRPKQLDVQRSELAEIVAAEVLVSLFDCVVPASRVASKELPDQQSRGVDVLALKDIETADAKIVLSEVKGSCASASPPAVVQDMRTKLTAVASDRRALLQELLWIVKHASEEHAERCGRLCAVFLLRRWNPEIVFAPILLRTVVSAGEADPGTFETDAESIGHRIHFISVVIDASDLFEFARTVYRLARERTPR